MNLPQYIRDYLLERMAEVRTGGLSGGRSALCVASGLGSECYISPGGDAFVECYDLTDDSPPVIDRSPRGQIAAIVLGKKLHPILIELLPTRTQDATDCETCDGHGFLAVVDVLCPDCAGLGWISPSYPLK